MSTLAREYKEMFSNSDYGKFNNSYGKYVKKDAEFWAKVNIGKVSVSNEAVKLRRKFKVAQTSKEKKRLIPRIIAAEKRTPSPTPSVENFSKEIISLNPKNQSSLNTSLAKNEFTGYDSYLLKQFLLSNKHVSYCTIPHKLDKKIDELQNQEIFSLDDEAPKKIGGGKYHTVYKTKVMQGNEEKDVIWKSIATNTRVNMGKMSSAYMSGINKIESKAALEERSTL